MERVAGMSAYFYKDAVGALLIYDIGNRKSFENLRDVWIKQIEDFGHPNMYKILIGNKCDNAAKREVSVAEAKAFADEMSMCFYETSARTSENVNFAFRRIIYAVGSLLHDVVVHLDVAGLPSGWSTVYENGSSESETGSLRISYMNVWTGEIQKARPTVPALDGVCYFPEERRKPETMEMTSRESTG